MNLRTLKKLSKRAAPLLVHLGLSDHQQFRAQKDGNYHDEFIGDRKHWERSPCHLNYQPRSDWIGVNGAEIVFTTRAGKRIVMKPPSSPRKGTIMVGGMSGYYEPEWDERSAWDELKQHVISHFTDWDECVKHSRNDEFIPRLTRQLDTPSDILAAAREMIAAGVRL